MDWGIGNYGFGFIAGVLSTLSPCVLPILPILIGSATATHRGAPMALAGGLALSYALVGTVVASFGASIGLTPEILRMIGAILLLLLGIVMMSSTLQARFAANTAGIGNLGHDLIHHINLNGLRGQFIVGLIMGVVWSPCVGPTLGATIVLASQGAHLTHVALMMGLFGFGAALPLVFLAYISKSAMMKSRGQLLQAGKTGKVILGAVMIGIAALILIGADKTVETWLVSLSPEWLTKLTTRF